MLPFPVPEMVDSGDEYDRTLFSDEDPGWRRLLFGHLTKEHHDDCGAMSNDLEETETDDEPVPSWGRRDDYYSRQGVAELASKLPVPLPRSASLSRKSRSAATQQKLDKSVARYADVMARPLIPQRTCCKSDQCHFASKAPSDTVRLHKERSEFQNMMLTEKRRYIRGLLEGIIKCLKFSF